MKKSLLKMESLICKCILTFLILLISVPISLTSPVRNIGGGSSDSSTKSPSVVGASSLLPFLKKFGYLESGNGNSSDHESDTLYTQESVELAIKEMQKFGGIRQSGMLDNATLALLTKPRCGLPDVIRNETAHGLRRKRYVIGANGWNKRRLTYRVENWAPQLSESSVEAEVRQAFDTWADYASLRFINKPRWNNDDVDISISFGRGYHGDRYPFDGSGGVLAHAFFPYGHGSLGGDIHFDLDENWGSNDDNDNSPGEHDTRSQVKFLAVAVHEIGHSLGLSHSPSQDSVMFPYYQYPQEGQTAKTKLGYDDIMAMYQLYIQRSIEGSSEDDDDMNEPVTPSPSPTTTTESVPASTSAASTPTTEVTGATVDTDVNSTTTASTTEGNKAIPDICSDGYDTISFLRNELFVFKNEFMWRFREKAERDPSYPVESSRLFPMLANVTRIDAAFENMDGKIYFFSGNQYWIYDHNEHSHALPLTDFGLSEDVQKIDAAFIWAKNGKLYLFSDNSFWKYNIDSASLDEGYPKSIERWRGLPRTGINSVLKWSDGRTYFFKNEDFWRFDDTSVHTDEGFPLKTGPFWFGC